MKKILIVSSIPDEHNIKDGFYQRVQNIDDKISHFTRTYLQIGYNKNFSKKVTRVNNDLIHYKVNFFLHFITIVKLIVNHKNFYFHSLHNYKKIFPISFLIRKKNVVIDVHGVVPQEALFKGKFFHWLFLCFVERFAFKKANTLIFVTNAMCKHYENRYSFVKSKNLINYAIFSSNVFQSEVPASASSMLCTKHSIDSNDTIVIYSGNLQKWQNIDLMISTIALMMKRQSDITFLILTMEIERFREKLVQSGIFSNKIIVTSASPKELAAYYELSHYGFILRDDHIVNRVACPTKIVEYLYYGVIPIVKSPEVGDFMELGYEYLTASEFDGVLIKRKSDVNRELAKNLMKRNQNIDIASSLNLR